MTVGDLAIAMLPQLQLYHAAVSFLGALGAVMMMQVVGAEWTIMRRYRAWQWVQRAVLAVMAVALFCSGLRMPMLAADAPMALLSAAAVNTTICLAILPSAVIGYSERRV
jgi:hypothetical protein